MKVSKKMKTALMGTALLAGLAFTGAQSAAAAQITHKDQALTLAYQDAGVSPDQVHSVKIHRDQDNDRPVYEIEFKKGRSEYDYTIDIETGSITEKDIDLDESDSSSQGSQKKAAAQLSIADAKKIALTAAGVTEAQVSKLKVDPDSDNDVPTYKIEFKQGRIEYRYTINAVDGSILQAERN